MYLYTYRYGIQSSKWSNKAAFEQKKYGDEENININIISDTQRLDKNTSRPKSLKKQCDFIQTVELI